MCSSDLCNHDQPPTIDRERPLTVTVERVVEALSDLLGSEPV